MVRARHPRSSSRPTVGTSWRGLATFVLALAIALCLVLFVAESRGSSGKAGAPADAAAHRVSASDGRSPTSAPTVASSTPAPPAPLTAPTTLPPTTTSTTEPTRSTMPQDPTPVESTIPSPVMPPTDTAHGVESPVGSLAPGSPANASALASGIDPALVDITAVASDGSLVSGTGIVVAEAGEVLTNDHVVDGATDITATDVGNGQSYVVDVVGTDEPDDVAVVQLEGASGLQSAPLGDSDSVRLGEGVVAVGNANGEGGTPSYAGGVVTAVRRHIVEQDNADGWDVALDGVIETNAQILPGDSGGALVDPSGEVVGIDTAILTSGGSGGFAIPIDKALLIAQEIEEQAG